MAGASPPPQRLIPGFSDWTFAMPRLPVPPPCLLTIPEVAAQLRLSSKTVHRQIECGALHVHRFGRRVRVSAEDLALFVSQRRR